MVLDLEAWAGLSQVVREGDILGRDVSKRHVGRGRDGGGGGGGRGVDLQRVFRVLFVCFPGIQVTYKKLHRDKNRGIKIIL